VPPKSQQVVMGRKLSKQAGMGKGDQFQAGTTSAYLVTDGKTGYCSSDRQQMGLNKENKGES
jgi:hypothetical protein